MVSFLMKNNKLSICTGVIGVGSMGQNHARVYNEISNLVAVSDPNEAQGREVAERFGVNWYANYKDMLEVVDAVSIAAPTVWHREIAEVVALAGVHLLVEKPIAGTVSDAEAIIITAKSAGVTLAVGQIERHNPVVQYAKKALARKEWGDLITLSSTRVSTFPERIVDVGVIFDFLIHDIDVMNYLCADVVSSVYASGRFYKSNKHEDHACLVLNFGNGIVGICEASWLTPMKVRKLRLTCSTHFVELDYIDQSIKVSKSDYKGVDQQNLFKSKLEVESNHLILPKNEPLKSELQDFLNAIITKTSPLVTGEEGLLAVKVAQAASESLNNHNLVNLNNK